jgi:hypothetical protein
MMYDAIVIGGGSGGSAFSKRAAGRGRWGDGDFWTTNQPVGLFLTLDIWAEDGEKREQVGKGK